MPFDTHGRFGRRGRAVQQVKRGYVGVVLIDALGVDDGRIVIGTLAKHRAQTAGIETDAKAGANDGFRSRLKGNSEPRSKAKVVGFDAEIEGNRADAGDQDVACGGIETARAAWLGGSLRKIVLPTKPVVESQLAE